MQTRIIPDSRARMVLAPEHRQRLKELLAAIEEKYAVEMQSAGLMRRWALRRRIAAEFKAERRKIEPSDYAV
jgi:hypothetical protein